MSGADDYPPGYGGMDGPSYQLSYQTSQGYGGTAAAPAGPPPLANVEAEAALLGGLMLANNLIPYIAEMVSPADFYEPLHGRIFRQIVRLHEKGKTANPVILRPIFESDPDMKELGGPAYLAQLTGSGAAIVGLNDFAEQVAELAVRRNAVDSMREGIERLTAVDDGDGVDGVDEIVSAVSDGVALAMTRASPMKLRSSASAINRVMERQIELDTTGAPVGASCKSVTDMDKIIGPAELGTYNVLGGRPGQCKTTLACSAAWGYAANGSPSLYLHGEMTADQLAMRHAADLSHAMGVPIRHDKIRGGKMDARDFRALETVKSMADTLPLDFVATGACDIRRVESLVARAAMKWKREGRKLEIVWLDYLQKFTATDDRGRPILDPTQAASAVSGACARIAERFGVALFALAQLSRAVDDRKDHRPQLNDLKQSGRIEEDADSVTLLYRPEYYLAKEKPKDPASKAFQDWQTEMDCVAGQVELIGEKNRHGPGRTRTVKFIGAHYAIRSGDFAETDAAILGPDLFDGDEEAWGAR